MKIKRFLFGATVAFLALALLLLELISPTYTQDETLNTLVSVVITRAVGGLAFLLITLFFGYRVFGLRKNKSAALVALAALAVAVNNLPIIGLVSGNAWVEKRGIYLLFLILEALAIGFFEEFTFRGVLFTSVLETRRGSSKEIFKATLMSSLMFGLIHLCNVFFGGGIGATLLQAGYSTLIGGMLSIVLLKTGSIWLCVAIHAIYDFCGYLVPTLGGGRIWDGATVAITAVLGIAVFLFMLRVLWKIKPEQIDYLFPVKENKNDTRKEKL